MLETRAPHVPPPALITDARPRFRPSSPTVLVVAGDAAARRRYVSALRGDGYTVHVADGSQSAMVLLRDLDPSLTLVDLVPLERMRLVDALMQLDPEAPLFVVDDPEQDVRTAVSVLRRHDEELPPAV